VASFEKRVLSEAEILRFLASVERGEIVLTADMDPDEIYGGVVTYAASNGWRIAIFNDCSEWDYIEWIEVGDERVAYADIADGMPAVAQYEPPDDVVKRAYGIGRPPIKPTRDDLEADERSFTDVREVLAGRQRFHLDAASSKMLRVVLSQGSVDAQITLARFIVDFGKQKRRHPFCCERRLAPPVVSELLTRAAVESVREPLVIGLPAGTVQEISRRYPAWDYDPKLVWIVPTDANIKVIVRNSPERSALPFVDVVPNEGALALRELPEWSPPTPAQLRYEEFAGGLSCPNCGTTATRYRSISNALVCGSCRRSFTP
jgi:hypothetical protein